MIYEYECKNEKCGKILENAFPTAKAPDHVLCIHCGHRADRKFSALNVHMQTWKNKVKDYNKLPDHAKD